MLGSQENVLIQKYNISYEKKALLFQTSKKPERSCGGNSFQYYCFIKYIDFRAPICSKENTLWDRVQLLSSPMALAECVTFIHSIQ